MGLATELTTCKLSPPNFTH